MSDGGTKTRQALSVPDSNTVLDAILELNRSVTVDLHEDEVVHTYVDTFRRIFPGRMFCVRLVSTDTGELSTGYATGRLRSDRRELLALSQEAVQRHSIDVMTAHRTRIVTTDDYEPVFEAGVAGFDVPMMNADKLVGLLAVEYDDESEPPDEDHHLIVQLSLQLGSALRNSRLHRESVYLRDYLSKLLDNANAPIMVVGRRGQISFANRAFLALTEFTRDEVLGKEWMTLLPESERRRLLPVFINALRGEPTSNVEVRLPRRDNTFAHVAVNTASILSADGDVEGVIYIYRDITEIRELEEQIIHAEKLATLGQLAAGVVHELNNPLTSIAVYAEFLHKKAKQDGAEAQDIKKLGRIMESAERILRFTQDLVAYARPSTEEPRLVDVHEVLDQAMSFCDHVIEDAGAKVSREFADDLPPIYAVKGQLVQVWVNLITNACHAMPLGAGVVVLRTEPGESGTLVVTTADSGKGIPEDNVKRIFEPFFSTKGEGKGTGLGLSIVRNIVEQHRGEISVQSQVGEGTTFRVVLPARHDHTE